MDNTEKRKIPIWFLVVVILIAMSVLGYFGTKNSNKSIQCSQKKCILVT